MSEYIDNATRRKETVKNILRSLHQGRSVNEVKAEFSELLREVGSSEIAEIEQMLMNEGLPVSEIQNLCDVHVAAFRDGLDDQRPPETIPGHPLHTLRAENLVLLGLLDELQGYAAQLAEKADGKALYALRMGLERLAQFERHYLRKENLLFPFLEGYGFMGPSKVMWGIHDETRADLSQLRALAADSSLNHRAKLVADFRTLETSLREMAYKEEKILFPTALEMLKEQDWLAVRDGEADFGYFMVEPGREWRAVTHDDLHPEWGRAQAAPDVNGPLPMSTGALNLEQINLMLTHLPVDITFVNEQDEVCFFSQTRERIFDRTAAIIGRKVQNCHPPQSVGRVQRILDDFRAGVRDTAEFWIPFGGKFVHIRYFALRDAQGCYRGTIEVTQDLAPLRALQGEKRLLDDLQPERN